MRKILKLIRWNNWYDSKLPLFFLAYYYLLIIHNEIHLQNLILLLPLGVIFISLASFGYMINNYFDKTVDRASGKENILGLLPHWQQIAALVIAWLIGVVAFTPFYQYKSATTFAFLTYLSSILYSAPPIRLKERGIWGIIFASLAQRVFPVLIVFGIFEHFKFDALIFAIFSFLIGVRWILIHQILDYDKDIQANVKTFAVSFGPVKVYNLMLFFFSVESIFAIAVIGTIYIATPFMLFVIIVYFLFELYLYPIWEKLGLERILTSYDFAPLADLYYLWLPLSLSIYLSCINPWFFIIVGLEIMWKKEYIKFDFRLVKLRRQYT